MGLKVLNVAYPLAPVGSNAVGGAEQVLSYLDQALTDAGHESFVIACEESQTAGDLVCVPRQTGELDDRARELCWANHRQAIAEVLAAVNVDLIHLHGIDFFNYLPPAGVPVLITLHLPLQWYPAEIFRHARPRTWFNCVSLSQQATWPAACPAPPVIPNGVATGFFPVVSKRGNFAISLGRICPEKGFHLALDAARRAGVPYLLCGEVFGYAAHQHYFSQQIVPRLDRLRRFLGPVGFERKRRLLSAARCLLISSLVPETSSLVAMEAMACGTPVVAFPSGALKEIVEPGVTGFLVQNEDQMAGAIHACSGIDRPYCSAISRDRFSSDKMVRKYFELYARLADSPVQQTDSGEAACVRCSR